MIPPTVGLTFPAQPGQPTCKYFHCKGCKGVLNWLYATNPFWTRARQLSGEHVSRQSKMRRKLAVARKHSDRRVAERQEAVRKEAERKDLIARQEATRLAEVK